MEFINEQFNFYNPNKKARENDTCIIGSILTDCEFTNDTTEQSKGVLSENRFNGTTTFKDINFFHFYFMKNSCHYIMFKNCSFNSCVFDDNKINGTIFFIDCSFQSTFINNNMIDFLQFKRCKYDSLYFKNNIIDDFMFYDPNPSNKIFKNIDIAKGLYKYDKPIIGYKKCFTKSNDSLIPNCLVTFLIPRDAKKIKTFSKIQIASKATPITIESLHSTTNYNEARAAFDDDLIYKVNEEIDFKENFNEDFNIYSLNGIKFYLTRQEAEAEI